MKTRNEITQMIAKYREAIEKEQAKPQTPLTIDLIDRFEYMIKALEWAMD